MQLAKARKQRAQQGGLLTPAQRAEEQRAAKTLAAICPGSPSGQEEERSAPPASEPLGALPPRGAQAHRSTDSSGGADFPVHRAVHERPARTTWRLDATHVSASAWSTSRAASLLASACRK